MTTQWTNWSGSVSCHPQTLLSPQNEAEIQNLLRQSSAASTRIRVIGSGHSFVPLCASDEILLSLDNLQGLIASQPFSVEQNDNDLATFWAGTKIYQIGDPLWQLGLAMANMGDIDRQAIAGAISTGTHGTGRTLGSIATQVAGLRLVLATGEVIDCSETQEREIFKAAQVSLGMLGVITRVTLRGLPAYHLHERTWVAGFDQCMAELEQHVANNRHFEFFWSPAEDACAMKTLNPVALSAEEAETVPIIRGVRRCAETSASSVESYIEAGEVEGRLARYMKEARIDRSYRIFPSERNLKFNEMEFAIPAVSGPDCLGEIRQLMQSKHRHVLWPIEYRTLAADDIWLSPAVGRATVTISIHQAAELDQQVFFADAEAIFRNHRGRPHWGKMHSHSADDLRQLYPEWERFLAIQQRLDPQKHFLNSYLRSIFQ